MQKEEQDQPSVYCNQYYAERGTRTASSIQQPILCRKRNKTSHQYTATNIMQKEEQEQPAVYCNQYYAERGTRPAISILQPILCRKRNKNSQQYTYSNLSYCALPLAMVSEYKDSDGPRLYHRELTLYSGAAHSLRLP
jgi:hypothetical protein